MREIHVRIRAEEGFQTARFMVQDTLIMLHAAGISAQWEQSKVGVQLNEYDDILKVGFHDLATMGYQSFYFDRKHAQMIEIFFQLLGFPMIEKNPE